MGDYHSLLATLPSHCTKQVGGMLFCVQSNSMLQEDEMNAIYTGPYSELYARIALTENVVVEAIDGKIIFLDDSTGELLGEIVLDD